MLDWKQMIAQSCLGQQFVNGQYFISFLQYGSINESLNVDSPTNPFPMCFNKFCFYFCDIDCVKI